LEVNHSTLKCTNCIQGPTMETFGGYMHTQVEQTMDLQ